MRHILSFGWTIRLCTLAAAALLSAVAFTATATGATTPGSVTVSSMNTSATFSGTQEAMATVVPATAPVFCATGTLCNPFTVTATEAGTVTVSLTSETEFAFFSLLVCASTGTPPLINNCPVGQVELAESAAFCTPGADCTVTFTLAAGQTVTVFVLPNAAIAGDVFAGVVTFVPGGGQNQPPPPPGASGGAMTGGGQVNPAITTLFGVSVFNSPTTPTTQGGGVKWTTDTCRGRSDSYTATITGNGQSGSSGMGEATIHGTGHLKDGTKVEFDADAQDNQEPNQGADFFSISVYPPGMPSQPIAACSFGGNAQKGNLQYHPAKTA
jgi:hypothetical protein